MGEAGVLLFLGFVVCCIVLIAISRGSIAERGRTSRSPPATEARAQPKDIFQKREDFEDKTRWDPSVQFDQPTTRKKFVGGDLHDGIRKAERKRRRSPPEASGPTAVKSWFSPRQRAGIVAIAAIAIHFTFPSATRRDDRWRGHAYPDRLDLTESISLGEFYSPEECQGAAERVLRATHQLRCRYCDSNSGPCEGCEMDPLAAGDWECGKNCEADDYGGYACE
jgi:hypothetical protein